MQKRNILLTFILSLFSISFISAYRGYGYRSFSLGNMLDMLDPSTVFLTVIFIVAFGFIYFALNKFFKENTALSGVVSFALALGITYWAHITGLDFEGFFYELGITTNALAPIIFIALILFLVYAGFKWGWGSTLVAAGLFLIFTGIIGLVYEKGVVIFLGIIFLIVGAVINSKKEEKGWIEKLTGKKL